MPGPDRPLRILLVSSRDPGGRRTGRKTVIATIVGSLVELGHRVEVAALGPAPLAPPPWGDAVPVHRLAPPGPLRIAANVAWQAGRGRMSLNECLFHSRPLGAAVAGLAARMDADVVVADMIRTYGLAASTGRPVVVDLDDLLSERYRQMRRADPDTIVGYFGDYLPPVLRRPASVAAARLLSVESRLLARRELQVASQAAVTCLVSAAEAQRLAARVGRPVEWSPMAVPVAASPAGGGARRGPVFVGGMDYHANRQAVRWYRDAVLPELAAFGAGDLVLDVVGHCPDDLARQLACDGIRFLGYASDLAATLRRYRVAVAPVVSGTGIKTKVLEAMGMGLCVVSTPLGVAGLPVSHGEEVMVGGSARDFAAALAELWADPDRASDIGERARRVVAGQFSQEAAKERWRRILRRVGEGSAGRLPSSGSADRPAAITARLERSGR
ncbi:MAG TPA: glycosyltransferase family 4 protein [Acidimicrobiales bacterium]|nr:glycosyltransferase family 4 protein [Acidimicrobiales bacterium]